jgi:hypothetical protein
MKTYLLASLAAGLLAIPGTTAAHAASFDYRGGCGYDAINDTTPGGLLGGSAEWHGAIHLAVILTGSNGLPNLTYGTASCELLVDGVSQGTVLGPAFGVGVIADAGPLVFHAAVTQTVTICDHVTVGGEELVRCNDAAVT